MASSSTNSTFSRFELPGLNLPLNWTPYDTYIYTDYGHIGFSSDPFGSGAQVVVPAQGEGKDLFQNALNVADSSDGFVARPMTTLREFTMLHIMNSITDKPNWDKKVFDDTIAEKWKAEALATPGRDISQKMVDWVIEELRFKAKIFQKTSAVSVFDGDVVKSDTVVSEEIKKSLKDAIRILEDIPEIYKDYHPGSDGKVLDLVHPSLFPLIYGKSRVLENSIIGLNDCIQNCGKGAVVPIRSEDECKLKQRGKDTYYNSFDLDPYSRNFQWLPSEVEFTKDGNAKFSSYINNLHPQKYQNLYAIIEHVIDQTIPLWNMTLTPLKATTLHSTRINYVSARYSIDPDDIPDEDGPQRLQNEDEEDYYERREEWKMAASHVVQPEPDQFRLRTVPDHIKHDHEPGTTALKPEKTVELISDYGHRGLQIIVKLANIELTPEKSEYEGGTWHVEGQLNEHICATALYYYDSENISESRLAFRQQCSDDTMDISYAQDHHGWLSDIFGCEQGGPQVQELGSVLCKEGRLLTFPNILQHRVQPFKLEDPTRPGHRKILALFLVDPGIRIISTANVPPQQRDWWSENVIKDFSKSGKALGKLSGELKEKVFESVDDFPISMGEAKEVRLKLMEERKRHVANNVAVFEANQFSLCEH